MLPKLYSANSSIDFVATSADNRIPLGPNVSYWLLVEPFHVAPRPDLFRGYTALHLAAMDGKKDACLLLLGAKSDINMKTGGSVVLSSTACSSEVCFGQTDVRKLLSS